MKDKKVRNNKKDLLKSRLELTLGSSSIVVGVGSCLLLNLLVPAA